MTAAIYTRVSTADQKHASQLGELREYAARQGWDIREYSDTGSGAKARRPGLDALMEDCRWRRVDVVLVWKLDRFARSLHDLLDNVRQLDRWGVRFIAVTQSIDTNRNDPISRCVLAIFSAVGEFERSLTIERVRAGMEAAKRNGKHCGRPMKIWRRDLAVEMREQGMSWGKIALKLKVPVSTVRHAYAKRPVSKTRPADCPAARTAGASGAL